MKTQRALNEKENFDKIKRFLTSRKLYNKFCVNMKAHSCKHNPTSRELKSNDAHLKHRIKMFNYWGSDKRFTISSGFYWSDSIEGYEFWYKVQYEFIKLYDSL